MRASVLRKLAAAAVALVVVLPVTVQPAQADPDGPNPSLIEFVDLALDLAGRLGGGGGLSPEAIAGMTQDIINALNNAESAVIAHGNAAGAVPPGGVAAGTDRPGGGGGGVVCEHQPPGGGRGAGDPAVTAPGASRAG